ncbi:MAG: glycerate kinase [Kiritimatiellaeota bacterium]|nr:glycerate kinase [Kiritimatiellota bacterium]
MQARKILLVPDSFKGTLSAARVCAVMRERILARFPTCEVVSLPVADGGEGTVDCLLQALGGERVACRVNGPFMEPVESFYGVLPDGSAVVEMAAAAGLPMVRGRENPGLATTFGVGELFLDAARRGCKKILVGLGGSCTNDLGAGAAAAAGARFFDAGNNPFIPTGATLGKIARLDLSALRENFEGVLFSVMCDIDNPLFGPRGAAHVFAPQKGADAATAAALDANLRHAAGVIEAALRRTVAEKPGAGAAGGMGAGMDAFFNAIPQPGITAVLDAAGFDEKLAGADFVFTGEGRLDSQSMGGKVVVGVARRVARRAPVIAFPGAVEDPVDDAYANGVTAIFPATRRAAPLDPARCAEDLGLTVDNFLRLLKPPFFNP